MFTINDDLSIYVTRGDRLFFTVTAEDNGKPYKFQAGDVVRLKVYGKKDAENVVLQKDFPVMTAAEKVEIYLTEDETRIGGVISKPTDYWYEVELNPFDNPQTIIGYDEDGAKIFKLFPEGDEVPEYEPEPEEIPVVDKALDMTSTRPVQNQAIARAVTKLDAAVKDNEAANTELEAEIAVERSRIDNLVSAAVAPASGEANYLEVVDIRVGADGSIYESAGTAVRAQVQKLNAFAASAVGTGIATIENTYVANETKVGIDDCTTQGVTPSQAYGNGTTFRNNVRIKGIRLLPTITATSFSAFVFDGSDNLIETVVNISPTIKDSVFNFESPVHVPAGGYMLLRFLNGVFFYRSIGASSLKEYQPGVGSLIDSPIKIGIEYIYDDVYEATVLKDETILPEIQLRDYEMPRFVADNEEAYTFYGRWYDHVVDGETFKAANADGSSFAFRVSGATKVNVGLYAINNPFYVPYFAYSIDGSEFIRQRITDTTIPVPDDGEHWVWIVVDGMGENDPVAGGKWYGSVGVYFVGVTTDGVLSGAKASNKQIMFIGDSIVEGINVLGAGANADTNSATKGFAFKTARLLNAIPLLCGYGGTAVLGNSSFHKPIEAIDYNLNGVPVNEQRPDIICVEHGYNDGTLVSNGTYTADKFKAEYNALLDRIKVKYPGVQIVCLIPFKQSLRKEILECAKDRKYCHVVETSGWDVTYTDNAHLDTLGAMTAAENLAKSISGIFGKQYFM